MQKLRLLEPAKASKSPHPLVCCTFLHSRVCWVSFSNNWVTFRLQTQVQSLLPVTMLIEICFTGLAHCNIYKGLFWLQTRVMVILAAAFHNQGPAQTAIPVRWKQPPWTGSDWLPVKLVLYALQIWETAHLFSLWEINWLADGYSFSPLCQL